MNLYDICLESVMFDYYCTEGFKEGLIKAGKAVVKGIAKAIDFLINIARRTLNIVRNIIRKMMGKSIIKIENKSILTNFVTSAKNVKKIKHDMAEEFCNSVDGELKDMGMGDDYAKKNINSTAAIVLKTPYNEDCEIYDDIDKVNKNIDDNFDEMDRLADESDSNIKDARQAKERASNNINARHANAAKIMRDAYSNIMEDFVHDLDDIDSMKKEMGDDMKVSGTLIKEIDSTSKDLDNILKDLESSN